MGLYVEYRAGLTPPATLTVQDFECVLSSDVPSLDPLHKNRSILPVTVQ